MKFSVLISVYAEENPHYFDSAMESVYYQTLKPDQIVLVIDGPLTSRLNQVRDKWKEKFGSVMSLVELEKNRGLSAALNAGLAVCRNEWVVRMDTDDICFPNRLEVQATFIKNNPDTDVLGSLATIINSKGEQGRLLVVPVTTKRINQYVWTCPFIHPTVCFRKDKILALGGYDPGAGPRQDDYDLWYRCAAAGYVFRNIPQPLLLFRFTDRNIRRHTVKVGYYRIKTGLRGNRKLGYGVFAYVGIVIPFFRSLLPYPLNVWVYNFLSVFNPRSRVYGLGISQDRN